MSERDWQGRAERAEATIADLRSQLEHEQSLRQADLRGQQAAIKAAEEYRAQLEVAQREREAIITEKGYEIASLGSCLQVENERWQAERTKREEAEQEALGARKRAGATQILLKATERRLGEVLAAGIELDAAAVALRLCTRWKTNEPEASVDRARRRWSAALARQTEESG